MATKGGWLGLNSREGRRKIPASHQFRAWHSLRSGRRSPGLARLDASSLCRLLFIVVKLPTTG